MTDEQIRIAFLVVVGCEPRGADLVVLAMMGTDEQTVAEYLWDHWLGEPRSPSLKRVVTKCREVVAKVPDDHEATR